MGERRIQKCVKNGPKKWTTTNKIVLNHANEIEIFREIKVSVEYYYIINWY